MIDFLDLSPNRPGGNRTPNRRFWRPVLYQLSYGPNSRALRTVPWRKARCAFSSGGWLTGIEPATPGATDRCSNRLSYSHHVYFIIILTQLRINRTADFGLRE